MLYVKNHYYSIIILQYHMKVQSMPYKEIQNNGGTLKGLHIQHYHIREQIGHGTYAKVYKAVDVRLHKLVAIKFLDKYAVQNKTHKHEKVTQIMKYIKSQGQILSKFNHPNILPLQMIYQNKDIKLLVTKFCRHKNLHSQIQKLGVLEESHAVNVIQQVANGLSAMHSQNIIHRDLKAENIFKNNGQYYIGDLGLAKYFIDQGQVHTACGSKTQAPEVQTGRYNISADIWSLGVLFLQMIYLGADFEVKTLYKFVQQGKFDIRLKNGTNISARSKNFLKQTLVMDPKRRLNWMNLKNHEIFKSYHSQANIINSVFHIKVKPLSKIDVSNILQNSRFFHSTLEYEAQVQHYSYSQQFQIGKIQMQKQVAKIPQLDEQSNYYNKLCEFHLNCKIAEFIMSQYIEKIESYEIFDMSAKKTVQLMYLLACRSFFYMSRIKVQAKIYSSAFFSEQLEHLSNKAIQQNYKKAQAKFREYSKKLTNFQNKLKNIVLQKLWLSGRKYKDNLQFFEDIEGIGYCKEQQINLTQQYLLQMKPNFKKIPKNINKYQQSPKYEIQCENIEIAFKNYTTINSITVQDIQKYGFERTLRKIMDKNKKQF